MNRKRFVALFAAIAGVLGTLAAAPQASADHAPTYEIQVGHFFDSVPAESMRFLAPELNVHAGSVLHFGVGPHTATALPTDVTDVDAWIQDNQVGLGKPFSVAVPDPDDGANSLKYNPAVWFPPLSCGSSETPCEYDGTSVVNSGFLFFSEPAGYSMTVDAEPGSSFWIVCLIHPGMTLKVNVVDDATTATTQAEIDSFRDTTIAADQQEAQQLHETLVNRRRSRRLPNGTRQWRAWAGFDQGNISLFGMFPRRLNIKKGDSVRWRFDALSMETHTVTMPRNAALEIVNQDFQFVCDPDGDEGAGPDTPADFSTGAPQCPDPTQLEIDAADQLGPPVGNGVYRGPNDVESSGIAGALAGDFSPYTVRFRSRNGGRPVVYLCLIHPFIRGRISISRR